VGLFRHPRIWALDRAVMDASHSDTLDLDPRAIERDASASSAACATAPEGIRVGRMPLIEVIKLVLTDLHDRRRRCESLSHSQQLEEKIKSWEDVLARLKELSGRYVSLQQEDLPPQFC
jgi:hypothetical protein